MTFLTFKIKWLRCIGLGILGFILYAGLFPEREISNEAYIMLRNTSELIDSPAFEKQYEAFFSDSKIVSSEFDALMKTAHKQVGINRTHPNSIIRITCIGKDQKCGF